MVIDWLLYVLARVFVAAIQTLSYERCNALVTSAAWCLARSQLRRETTDANLDRVFPGLSDVRRLQFRQAMWHHLLLMVCEIAWATRRIHRTNWKWHVTITDKTAILGPLLANRPAVVVTGHYGNFELGGYMNGLFGLPSMTIARPLDNVFLNRYLTQFRGVRGQVLVPKNGSASLVDHQLRTNGTLVLLADQHAGAKGCWVNFLGHPASCHKSLALFTLVGGAPMIVVATRRVGGPMRFEIGAFGNIDPAEPCDRLASVQALTEWYNARLAIAITKSPEQYWWLHRRWRGEPPPKKVRIQQAA